MENTALGSGSSFGVMAKECRFLNTKAFIMENNNDFKDTHDLKKKQRAIDEEKSEALKKFQEAFKPAANIKEADLVMSLYEIERWFEGIGVFWDGKQVSANIKEIGFTMEYSGSMYLFALKNNV